LFLLFLLRVAFQIVVHHLTLSCLTAHCKKMLDSTNATEHDDELFCRSCYGKKFGPKGYGYGGGAGVLSMDDGTGYVVSLMWRL
jgi:cysteine/glycine-rich protein